MDGARPSNDDGRMFCGNASQSLVSVLTWRVCSSDCQIPLPLNKGSHSQTASSPQPSKGGEGEHNAMAGRSFEQRFLIAWPARNNSPGDKSNAQAVCFYKTGTTSTA